MVRALISISDKSLKRFDAIARKTKKSRAQVMREALDLYLKKNNQEPTWKELVQQTAGMWKHKNIDTDQYLKKIRSDWDR